MSTFYGEDGLFGPPKVREGLQHHNFLIFDGKQQRKNFLVPWMLKSPLTTVLKDLPRLQFHN